MHALCLRKANPSIIGLRFCLNTMCFERRRPCQSLWWCGQLARIHLTVRVSSQLYFKSFCTLYHSLLSKEESGEGKKNSNLQHLNIENNGTADGIPSDGDDKFLLNGELNSTSDGSLHVTQAESKSFFPRVLPENTEILPAKCHGCGAIFQSIDPDQPGFITREKHPETFKQIGISPNPVCKRCFSIKHYNKAIPVIVNQTDVIRYLSHIQRRKALILYVIDVMDMPSSLFPGLLETVGESKRILIVGNKVDMLPVDGQGGLQQQRIKEAILTYCNKNGLESANVKGVTLISAKTGFGLSQLLGQMRKHWNRNGDIYLLGCSNTGKTTLFNLFLDVLNIHKDGNMLQRATVSLSSGTTLSLLRFPIGHWMLHKLGQRLHYGVEKHKDRSASMIAMDQEIMAQQLTDFNNVLNSEDKTNCKALTVECDSSSTTESAMDIFTPQLVLDDKDVRTQSWLYDTPGVVSNDQITQFLTMEELKLLNPQMWIVPRTFILKPQQVILLGGLARLDYVQVKRKSKFAENESEQIAKANQSIYFTVFASPNLPVHVTNVARAEEVYEKHAGNTDLLMIPRGGKQRMEKFPKLEPRDFSLTGIGWRESAADIVLSNVGWVAVTAGVGSEVSVRAYTPNAIGLHFREPALLPTSVRQRGKRGVRYQGRSNHCAYEGTRRSSPQFVKYLEHGNRGTYQWVKEAEKKRKEQRNLLKGEKINRMIEKSLGCSAVANPPIVEGAVAYPEVRKLKEPHKVLE